MLLARIGTYRKGREIELPEPSLRPKATKLTPVTKSGISRTFGGGHQRCNLRSLAALVSFDAKASHFGLGL